MTITFVGAGAAVTGNNAATLSPLKHASTAAGDLILVLASIRGTAGTPTVAGYTLLADGTNVRLYGKIAGASEPSPTVAFAGGAAGDDNIAQCATFRGIETSVTGIVDGFQSNGSALNVAYPAVTVPAINHAVIVAGWKQDDSTGWAAIAGYTEIGESNPTTGNDASQAWDYQIQTTATNLSSGSFTVSGGAAAVSKALTLILRPAAAISAVEQDFFPPRVLVSVTDLTLGDDVVVYRVVAGQRTALRAGTGTDVIDPSLLVVDGELPFDVPVSYVAVVNDSAEYATGATTYDLPGGQVVFSDAITGAAASAVISAWDEKTYDKQASVFKVGGRNVVVSGDLGQYEASIELFFDNYSSGQNLLDLLRTATQGVMQLRRPTAAYDGVDSYISVTGARERRYSQDGSDPRRTWVLDASEVDPWADGLQAVGFTYQDVADFYAPAGTYADAAGDYATYLLAEQGDYSP